MCRVEYFKQFFAIDIVNAACVSSSAVVVELVIDSQIAVSLSVWNITRIFSIGLQRAAIWNVLLAPLSVFGFCCCDDCGLDRGLWYYYPCMFKYKLKDF